MTASEQFFFYVVLFVMLHKVVLTFFKSMDDKTLVFGHLKARYLAVLS